MISQDYANWEWILVDDYSTDGSGELLLSLSEKGMRIKPHFLTNNQDSGPARNVVIELAQGKYIEFFDSNDIWIKEKLQIQVRSYCRI
ncbi:glycosyltransferase family A protein [Flavobacteriaceae bacterium KMM 6898]|nr:glycosyltransferase family A protein [Flavobacteriaceae bacterium KMM 6898]